MIKDLTTLKWKKLIYYLSEDTIFDIEKKRKKNDEDACGTYLIDIDNAPEKFKKALDGTSNDISNYPEIFINKVPYIFLKFVSDSAEPLTYYFPLQYLIEEGDKLVEDKLIQIHPNIYDNSYVNKFNLEVFDYIKKLLKDKEACTLDNILMIEDFLPDWLLDMTDKPMSSLYIKKYFLKGVNYNEVSAKGKINYTLEGTYLGIGDDYVRINIWTKEVIAKVVLAIYAEKFINTFNKGIRTISNTLTPESMESIASIIKTSETGLNLDNLNTFLRVEYNKHNVGYIGFESLCAPDNIDTYYEYLDKLKEDKEKIKSYYSLIKDEESWNDSFENGGLKKYYTWSDVANKPYKEDLWNTTANRAANINDVRKENEQYVLDENGNYIYDNCERCWEGAVNAPGAKYPWIVLDFKEENVNSTITFKYTYSDGTVKEVHPFDNKVFGSERTWGCVSIPTEFVDNDFLISENRKDGGESTFDIDRFELILTPAND